MEDIILKKTALFLAILMLLTLFVSACEKNPDNRSSVTGSESDVSEAVSETSSQTEDITPKFATVVSSGKSYTVNSEAGEAYPDTYNSELTDNIHAASGSGYGDA